MSVLKTYKIVDGLLQLVHIHIVALAFLLRGLLLDLGRPRATGDPRCGHLSALSRVKGEGGLWRIACMKFWWRLLGARSARRASMHFTTDPTDPTSQYIFCTNSRKKTV